MSDDDFALPESTRRPRVAKTTALLLSKFATMKDQQLALVRHKDRDGAVVKRSRGHRKEHSSDDVEGGGQPHVGKRRVVKRAAELSSGRLALSSSCEEDTPSAVAVAAAAAVKPMQAPVGRILPLRKSVVNRPLYAGSIVGDYLVDTNLTADFISQITARDADTAHRRHPNDPDPELERLWDTTCAVLGRGLLVARSRLRNAGFGLFATDAFAAGALVTEYTGPELDRDRARQLRAEGKDRYIRSLKNGFCIDGNPFPALGEGCAQMANDGHPDGVTNNCEFVIVDNDYVQEKPRVYLKTLRAVAAGEELLAGYGKTYWDIHNADGDAADDDDDDDDDGDDGDDGERDVADDDNGGGGGDGRRDGVAGSRARPQSAAVRMDVADGVAGDEEPRDGAKTRRKSRVDGNENGDDDNDVDDDDVDVDGDDDDDDDGDDGGKVSAARAVCLVCGDSDDEQSKSKRCTVCLNVFHLHCVTNRKGVSKPTWRCIMCSGEPE